MTEIILPLKKIFSPSSLGLCRSLANIRLTLDFEIHMSMVRISKEFTFEMAHALVGYDGKCAGLHGHSYHLTVTVLGKIIHASSAPRDGMVMDFSQLKKIVNEEVLEQFDHAVVLNEKDPLGIAMANGFTKLVRTPYQPTCENMVIHIAARLQAKLPQEVKLYALKLRETGTSYAEWFAADNK